MVRRDYAILADILGEVLGAGELSRGGFAAICAALDRDCPNFNRERFEQEVARIVQRLSPK